LLSWLCLGQQVIIQKKKKIINKRATKSSRLLLLLEEVAGPVHLDRCEVYTLLLQQQLLYYNSTLHACRIYISLTGEGGVDINQSPQKLPEKTRGTPPHQTLSTSPRSLSSGYFHHSLFVMHFLYFYFILFFQKGKKTPRRRETKQNEKKGKRERERERDPKSFKE
jgi:hypothetical protein